MVAVGTKKKNNLADLEDQVAEEYKQRRKHRRRAPGNTRIAFQVRRDKTRKMPPVPKNRSLAEIHEMTGGEKELRHVNGRPREHFVSDTSLEIKPDLSFRDMVRADTQRRANQRRMKIRKWEAEVIRAQEVLTVGTSRKDHKLDIYDEERAIAEGILTLDDWDNEELVRGYRRSRDGKFGKAPKYIPREIQQEAFRRLVHRGNRRLREAYMETLENLIDLAHNSSSDKVKLEAQKELLNRVVGKVPDVVLGAQIEQPWENILPDSILPFPEDAIDMEMDDSGIAQMVPYPEAEIVDAEVIESPPSLSPDSGGPRGGASPTRVVAQGGGASSNGNSTARKSTAKSTKTTTPRRRKAGARGTGSSGSS